MRSKKLHGVLEAYWEQGMEGGVAPAFQEKQFIEHNHEFGYCRKCGKPMGKKPVKIMLHVIDGKGRVASVCDKDAHEEFIGDLFDMNGFHFLEFGDRLEIFSKKNPSKRIWAGKIRPSDASTVLQHPDVKDCIPRNVSRKRWFKWFRENFPATLILRRKSEK